MMRAMGSPIIKSVDCPNQTFKSGELLFEEGSESSCFYIIRKGSVAVYKNFKKPNQLKLATVNEGSVLGEISGLDGLPRSAAAVADGPVEVAMVSSKVLKYQLEQCPGWFRAVILDLVERLRATDELLTTHGLSNANSVSSQKATAGAES